MGRSRGLVALLLGVIACGRSPVSVLSSDGGADGDADDGADDGNEGPDDPCAGGSCSDACAEWAAAPTTAGCSFVLVQHAGVDEELPDALVVTNPHDERSATVQLSRVPVGSRTLEAVEPPVVVGPGQTHVFALSPEAMAGDGSQRRTGGVFRLDSDAPVAAYQHAPGSTATGNDSLLLLPVAALGRDHVAHSYPGRTSLAPFGDPSYFDVIALEDGTVVQWTPLTAVTEGDGASIPDVEPGQTGSVTLERYDVLRVVASAAAAGGAERDVSGTVIEADAPVAVVSGCRCAQVPAVVPDLPFAGCDPLLEQLVPLAQWGDAYVAARAPVRGHERHHWRLYAGAPGVTVSSPTPVPGLPHRFDALGEDLELEVPSGTSFALEGDGPFMPVQYLQSAYLPEFDLSSGTSRGDPSMLQAVPTARFLARYVVATPAGFGLDIVQVVRRVGGADVTLDGQPIAGWSPIDGTYELAEPLVPAGTHVVESAEPFGLVQVGFTEDAPNAVCTANTGESVCFSSYAYAGGMALAPG